MIHAASLSCGDILNLERDVRELMKGGITFLHLDIMDGHDVPNFCLNFDHIKQLRALSKDLILETHLMVTNPCDFIEKCASVGSDYFVVHPSNVSNVDDYIKKVKKTGMKVGLMVNIEDGIDSISPYLAQLDEILLMSVTPGDYGRPFNPIVYDKVSTLVKLKKDNNYHYIINVDGGVTKERARDLKKLGADATVAGIFTVFRQPEGICESIKKLNEFINE